MFCVASDFSSLKLKEKQHKPKTSLKSYKLKLKLLLILGFLALNKSVQDVNHRAEFKPDFTVYEQHTVPNEDTGK